jgi:hypothetical protein
MANQSTPTQQISGFSTIDYVVAEMQVELDDYSTTQNQRLTTLVIAALREIRLYHKAAIQVAYLTINEAGIIPFPYDYMDFINIGIPMNGQIHNLTQDNKMLLDRDTDCGVDSRTMSEGSSVENRISILSPSWSLNRFAPTYYGVSGGRNTGYYKVDEQARQIQFDGRIPRGEIVLVYKSTGIGPNTVIGAEMIKPLKNITYYNMVKLNANVSMNQKMLMKKDMEESIMELRSYAQRFTMKQYMDVLWGAKRQTAKP